MGHAEISQSPGKRGHDCEESVGSGGAGGKQVCFIRHMAQRQGQVAGEGTCILHDCIPSSCLADPEEEHDPKGDGHDDALHKVSEACRQETACHGISDDDNRADDHGKMIIYVKQRRKEFPDRRESGCGIGNEKDHDDECRDQREDLRLIPETIGEKLGDGKGVVCCQRVAAKPFGYDQPVNVGADRKPQSGPDRLRYAGEIGKAGKTHQKPAAHIRCFRAHGSDKGAELPAAQVEITDGFIFSGCQETDGQHTKKVSDHGNDDPKQ